MSLIFDGFPSAAHAADFALAIERDYGLTTAQFASVAESDAADPFPYALTPPIVHVARTDEVDERAIETEVEAFGGRFAGT